MRAVVVKARVVARWKEEGLSRLLMKLEGEREMSGGWKVAVGGKKEPGMPWRGSSSGVVGCRSSAHSLMHAARAR